MPSTKYQSLPLKVQFWAFDLTRDHEIEILSAWLKRLVGSFVCRLGRLAAAIASRVIGWKRLTPSPASGGWRNTTSTAGSSFITRRNGLELSLPTSTGLSKKKYTRGRMTDNLLQPAAVGMYVSDAVSSTEGALA